MNFGNMISLMMWLSVVLVLFFTPYLSCYLYIDRITADSKPALSNVTVAYIHDATGQCIINATFETFVTITRQRIYFRINLPEDQNDRDFRRILVSSIVEVEKVFKGKQSNPIIHHFFSAVRRSMAFEYKMPLPPVSIRRAKQLKQCLTEAFRELTDLSTGQLMNPCFGV